MRSFWICLLLVLPVLAQDAEELLKKAKALDAKAEVLLDQGRRVEAFELLAEAADLRAQARAKAKVPGTAEKQPRPKTKKAKKKKASKKAKKAKATDPRQALDAAFQKLDQAVERGDMEGARAAAHEMRRHLLRWTKQLDAREKRLQAKGPRSVEARVAALEKQVKDLRRLLDHASAPKGATAGKPTRK
ncbi:MAG: hypothetical protein ACYTF8_10070 [Planctomycetota bacterium]|jgi:hypothetical protein